MKNFLTPTTIFFLQLSNATAFGNIISVIFLFCSLLLTVSVRPVIANEMKDCSNTRLQTEPTEELKRNNNFIDNLELIKTTQMQLKKLGFYEDKIDGIVGVKTIDAISRFSKRFQGKSNIELNQAIINKIAVVYTGRFESPFNPSVLIRPTKNLPKKEIYVTDIRNDLSNCEECRVTTFILESGDMDGDGLSELVLGTHRHDVNWQVTNETSPMKILSIKKGKAELLNTINSSKIPSRVHEREGIIRDFNGDGIGDLFVASQGHDVPPFIGEQNVLILSSLDGHKDVSYTHLPMLSDMAHGVDASDIDGDGDLDLFIITNENAYDILPYILINNGRGFFSKKEVDTFLDKSLVDFNQNPREHRAQYSTVRFADLNNDNYPDLILLARGESPHKAKIFKETRRSLIIYNDKKGKFPNSNIVEIPTDRWGYGTFSNDAEVIDLDSDGFKDLILTQSTRLKRNGAWRGQYLQVLMNRGDTFIDCSAERLWPQGYSSQPEHFQFGDKTSMADIDNDGDLDIITRSLGPSHKEGFKAAIVQIGINNGEGFFSPADPKWFSGGREHQGRAPIIGNFTGDGIADIASYGLNYIVSKDQTVGVRLSIHQVSKK